MAKPQGLTLGEASRALGVSEDTLRRWDRAGKLKTVRDQANRRRVPRSEIERLASAPQRHRTRTALSARHRFPGVVRSVEGSDDLAAQIRAGAPVDVYAAANTKLPDQLYAEGRVDRPLVFTANRLVLAVPAHSKLRSLADAAAPGLKLAIGASSVPVGEYTHHVL